MALDRTQSSPRQVDQHSTLRIVAICGFVPAAALLLPCGIISNRPLPAVGIAPMFLSAGFQALTINGRPRLPKTTFCINLSMASFLISSLVPSWMFMAKGGLSYWGGDGLTMMGAYGTMPMTINFVIHLYLAQRAFLLTSWYPQSGSICCCYDPSSCSRPNGIEAFTGKDIGGDDGRQPMIGFHDEDTRPSAEFLTSGFNTPRVSQETLESSDRHSIGDLV